MRCAFRHTAMAEESVTAIIVDDEALARRGLRQQLERHPDVRVLAECVTGAQAMRAIAAHDPDIVFLDIQLPGGSGFDVVNQIGREVRPAIVFVTAYNEHAVKAFEVNAVDYVLKPVDDRRFDDALERARVRLRSGHVSDAPDRIQTILQALAEAAAAPTGPQRPRRITIHDGDRAILLPVNEVDRLEAAGNYVRVHTGRRVILTRGTLQGVIDMLADPRFLRVHRSSVVNSDSIVQIEMAGKGLYVLGLRDGTKVETSYHYRSAISELLKRR